MKIAFFLNGSEPTFRIMSILADVARDMGFDSDYVGPDVSLHGNHERVRPGDVAVLDITRAALRQAVELGSLREAGVRVVLIAASSLEIPGDLSGYRTLIYGNSLADSQGLINTFRRELRALEEKPDADPFGWASDEKGNSVFISYSHTDEQYLRRLLVHLRPLDRQGMINVWSDQRIEVGDPWREKIEEALEGARIAVLLISADFLASDFIVNDELPRCWQRLKGTALGFCRSSLRRVVSSVTRSCPNFRLLIIRKILWLVWPNTSKKWSTTELLKRLKMSSSHDRIT